MCQSSEFKSTEALVLRKTKNKNKTPETHGCWFSEAMCLVDGAPESCRPIPTPPHYLLAPCYITVSVRILIAVFFFFFLGSVDEKTPYLALGAVKNISLNISISNLGDDAYDANVSFNVSRELFFINMWQKVRRAPLKGRHLPSNTPADLLCSMGHAMILQRPLLYKELGITRNRLSSWTKQAAGMAQVSAMNTYPRERLSYVVLRPFSLVDWPSLSSYSCYFQHIYIL